MITKTPAEIVLMRKAGGIVRDALNYAKTLVRPGITTRELDEEISQFIENQGASLPCKGYEGYPAGTCISVNEVVVHGIPGDLVLREGDIVSIDLVASYKGYCGDATRTFGVGKISPQKQRLIDVTENCFFEAIKNLKAGMRIGDISSAVQKCAESHGYSVVRELCGHGIGKNMHEDPCVPNYGRAGNGPVIKANSCLAIEPMINMGKKDIWLSSDGWTVSTRDGLPAAHYENTVLVTENGVEILTL